MENSPEEPDQEGLQKEAQDVMRRVKSFWATIAVVGGCLLIGGGYLAFSAFGGASVVIVLIVAVLALVALGWYLLNYF